VLVATQEYPSPSRAAPGQAAGAGGGRPRPPAENTEPVPSLFATRPLPETPAASHARAADPGRGTPGYTSPAATLGQPGYPASPPSLPHPTRPAGQPSHLGKASGNPGKRSGNPGKTATGQTASLRKASQAVNPGKTDPKTNPMGQPVQPASAGQPQPRQSGPPATQAAGWQSALPVSPWSAHERQSGAAGPELETETVLRSDLRALKRSRSRARLYLAGVVVLAVLVGNFGLRVLERNASKYRELDQRYRALVQQTRQMNGPAGNGSLPATGAAAAGAGVSSEATSTLADELKRQLIGDTAISVEVRADRVVVGMDDGALFVGNASEVGQAGYRVLYRFGKALKNVPNRRVVVTVVSNEGLHNRPWVSAVARGVALGRFLIDDLSVEPSRVSVSAPAPKPRSAGARSDRVEFSLEPMDHSSRS
jgi:hypothetical protein